MPEVEPIDEPVWRRSNKNAGLHQAVVRLA